MKFLANSTTGLQWSEKWQQHYFKIPPFVYKGAAIFNGLPGFPYPDGVNQTITIWQDDARSLAPKYAWAVEAWGGFGVWSTSLVCPLGQYEVIEVAYKQQGTSCEAELAKMWGAIPSPYENTTDGQRQQEQQPGWGDIHLK